MDNKRYFSESDYDLTLRLQELFQDTVDLQTQLGKVDLDNAKLKEERNALASRLKETHNEICRLVMSMKHLLSDSGEIKNPVLHTIIATNRSIH